MPDTKVVAVSSYELVNEAVGRVEDFSSNMRCLLYKNDAGLPEQLSVGDSGQQTLATADPPDHALHRLTVFPELVANACWLWNRRSLGWRPTTWGAPLRPNSPTSWTSSATVLLFFGAANRDPARYADPDTLDLPRERAQLHLAFGKGIHYCVGARLARLEATIVLKELLARTTHVELARPQPALG